MADALTPREVAEQLGVTVRTVQRWITTGRLPAQRIGGRLRVSRSSLERVARTDHEPAAQAIRTLLIANRGEIAERVGRTARRLGIRTIGVHAANDRPPSSVDEAHLIDSYLDGEHLIAVARRTGADAIHPGYGFLAENATFAQAVADAALAWVGPPPGAIAAMGDKAAARRLASARGIAVVPGYDGNDQSDAALAAAAERIGFPVLVKPTAGGGGKGMRVVDRPDALPEALAASRREARAAFADERLVLERYLPGARHVEVQVLFDAHGAGVHLGERDCSAQRRNQKVVEEAPAPSLTVARRQRMGQAAVDLASAVAYVSAGTVEMLLTDAGEFHFIEMNTRLQVEHPVTELVTGRDIVADQLRIAAGERLAALGLSQPPRMRGHAIEARLYAEDPEAGFLPATGRIALLHWPTGDGLRIDTGIVEGDEIGDRYDPMLAKFLAHGPDRGTALARLRAALEDTALLGVRSNLRFLRWLLAQAVVERGEVRTDTVGSLALPNPPQPADSAWQAAALTLCEAPGADRWSGGWRLNAPAVLRLRSGAAERRVEMAPRQDPPLAVGDRGAAHVDVEGQSIEFRVAPPPTVEDAVRHAAASGGGGASVLLAPMPGRVIAVRVAEGATVAAHEPVVVIEAMKMEHAVTAPAAGRLTQILVREGQQVQRGDLLAEVSALPLDA